MRVKTGEDEDTSESKDLIEAAAARFSLERGVILVGGVLAVHRPRSSDFRAQAIGWASVLNAIA